VIDLRHGDMLDVLPTLAADSIAACITDPPYHLTNNMGTRSPYPGQYTPIGRPKEPKGGFMGRVWDGGSIAFDPETWRAVHRVIKPGGYLLAMGGTRTFHRLACAIEDAGFEVRDTIAWVYGSGFPKSLDIGKAIDRAAGAEREVVGRRPDWVVSDKWREAEQRADRPESILNITAPATDAARQWNGWGTALKPAMELICVARKPLSERTVAANVLRHGTGGINVDACRVEAEDAKEGRTRHGGGQNYTPVPDSDPSCRLFGRLRPDVTPASPAGRWPANVMHDGSPEVEAAFAAFGTSESASGGNRGVAQIWGGAPGDQPRNGSDGSGSPSRFFYSAKATASDRADSRHPTVKPIDLIRWLTRLVTPPGGTVLDPFAGSGTTGEAAMLEGFDALLIEREAEHAADIRHRVKRWNGGDLPLFAETGT
jgi:site-specific DNA-methyltransferase (adenine-specific)